VAAWPGVHTGIHTAFRAHVRLSSPRCKDVCPARCTHTVASHTSPRARSLRAVVSTQVLGLYRSMLHAVNSKPEDGRQVWREHIRSEFEKSKGLSRGDVSAIEHRLRIGSRQYVLLPLAHTRPSMLASAACYTIPPISVSATISSSLLLMCILRHTVHVCTGSLSAQHDAASLVHRRHAAAVLRTVPFP
jgi:hypothetical protein